MFPYHRLNDILAYISRNREPVALEELTAYFHVSERTLRNDIQNMNAVLIKHGALIDRMRKKGYYLSIRNEASFEKFLQLNEGDTQVDHLDNAQKRIHYILQKLLFSQTYITQDELAQEIYVSRNTIMNYLKTIRIMICEYHLSLTSRPNLGIRIEGNEEAKRACFMELIVPHDLQSMITGFTIEEERIFQGIDLYAIEQIVLDYARESDVRFSDFNLRNLILHLALLITRLQSDCPLKLENITCDLEYNLSPLIQRMETAFDLTIPKSEMQYLYSHFMSNAKTMYRFEENVQYLQDIIEQLLEIIHRNYNFDLRHDTLLKEDLTQHFQSILNTKRYHLNKRNPLLNTIKVNYPLAYDITLTSVTQVLEHEPFQLTDDEIGYVSLHIGAAIERCFNAQIKKKSIIIVCGSGYATSRMLEAKLNSMFRDKITICGRYSYHEYQQMELKHIDFVISTIPIECKTIPVVTVDFSLYNHDVENITRMLADTEDDTIHKIDNFFEESLFFYEDNAFQKEELLHTLCQALYTQQYINEDFEASVLKRESIAATNMDEVLAIPHPMDLLSTQTKVAVALLKEPLAWNEKSSVRIVLLLAINRDDQQNIEHLYDTFIQIMNHSSMQNQLLKCHNFHAFMETLHAYGEGEDI